MRKGKKIKWMKQRMLGLLITFIVTPFIVYDIVVDNSLGLLATIIMFIGLAFLFGDYRFFRVEYDFYYEEFIRSLKK